jgi:hypothetical protein
MRRVLVSHVQAEEVGVEGVDMVAVAEDTVAADMVAVAAVTAAGAATAASAAVDKSTD